MSVPATRRLLPKGAQDQIYSVVRRIFGELPPGDNIRTGRRRLTQQMRGEAVADYIPPSVKDYKFRGYVDPEVEFKWEYKQYLDQIGDLKPEERDRDGFTPKWHAHMQAEKMDEEIDYVTEDEYPTDTDEELLLSNYDVMEAMSRVQSLLRDIHANVETASVPSFTSEQEKDLERAGTILATQYASLTEPNAKSLEGISDDEQIGHRMTLWSDPSQLPEITEASTKDVEVLQSLLKQIKALGYDVTTPESVEAQTPSMFALPTTQIDDKTKEIIDTMAENGPSKAQKAFAQLYKQIQADSDVSSSTQLIRTTLAYFADTAQKYSLLEAESDGYTDDEMRQSVADSKQSNSTLADAYLRRSILVQWLSEALDAIDNDASTKEQALQRIQSFVQFIQPEQIHQVAKGANLLDMYTEKVMSMHSNTST